MTTKAKRTVAVLDTGDRVSLFIGGAVGFDCVAVRMIHGTVVSGTEKAVEIEAETERGNKVRAWFPRRSLLRPAGSTDGLELAHWFNPTGWTAKFLDMTANVSGVSASEKA